MKKIVFFIPLLVLTVFTTSCNSQETNKPSNQTGNAVLVENQAETTVHKNVSANEFKQLIANGDVVVVDVRTPNEYAQGHIKGAKLINLYDPNFNAQIAQLDKGATTLVYCRSGRRSASAMRKMKSAGLNTVYNLSGGLGAWMSSGGQVVR
ncbi:MAG: rhodanese-like domain-containing protein [Bacteroidetes bacterium]|nr:MAG: rhodanese-like domain-containing protein [Bacteroidota bacterium]